MKAPSLSLLSDSDPVTLQHFLAVRSDGLSFLSCLTEAYARPDLLEQVDRLFGTNLLARGSVLDLMIDESTGRDASDMTTFVRFVWNYVFFRCEPIN